MPWSLFPWSDNIKKRCVRYLIQRYLGQFIEEKLTLDQLTVDLYNGTGSVSNVTLDVQALNELGEQQNLPIEFVDGFIKKFSISIPWSSVLRESSCVEVNGLYLVIQPKQRPDNGSFMFESMWSSMTSSMQLAEECLKSGSEEALNESVNPVNGVEELAKTMDAALNRVKIKFVNTVIRLEYLHKDSPTGGAVEMHINQFSYCDETSDEVLDENSIKSTSAYSVKLISLEGVEFFTNEFNASNRTISRSLLIESTMSMEEDSDIFERRRLISEENVSFAKFLSRQEVRLKFKQKENAGGPKIDLEFTISTLAVLLSPRQLRTVCEVVYGLMSPHLQDTSNVNRARCHQKPMTTSDFERVEMELNQQINPNVNHFVSKSLQNTTGWSSAAVDEESDDDFQPVKGHSNSMSCSLSNSLSSSLSNTGSYQSASKLSDHMSGPLKSHIGRHKEKGGILECDFRGEVTTFELRLNFVSLILLHQDILLSSSDSHLPTSESIKNMKAISKDFFAYFLTVNMNNISQYQQKVEQNPMSFALKRNHFRLLCSTLILKGDEKSNHSNSEINGNLSLANAELVECLVQMEDGKSEFIELLQFGNLANIESYSVSRPDVVVGFKYTNNMKRFTATNQTELSVALRHCRTEVDVTIIDRLSHILNHLSSLWASLDKSPSSTRPTVSEVHAPVVDSKFMWKVTSPFVTVKLRFPVPDLRHETQDDSYLLKREVYPDLLFMELSDITLSSETTACEVAQFFELLCKSAKISFQEATADKPLPFIFCGCDDKAGFSLPNGGTGFGWPRLVVRVYPQIKYFELEDEDDRFDMSENMGQSIIQTQKQEPSPFAAKMIKRETDTSHSRRNADYDGEEIILPGSKEEMGDFIEHASSNALLQFEFALPSIVVHLPSKHFCEIIYNRFNTDLMLWTPKSTKRSPYDKCTNNVNFDVGGSMITSFSMCKSAVRTGSDSDDEDPSDNLLFGSERRIKEKRAACKQQSKLTVSIVVTQGVVDIFPHARDSSGKVIPCQFGEVQLLFQEANLFCVSGYKGDALLNYVCLQMNQVSLYHCSLIPTAADMLLKPFEAYPSKYMLPTIYKSPIGAVINENAAAVGTGSSTSDDMLTLAIKVQGQESRLKSICVANSLNGATIRHRIKPPYSTWLSQIIDFFDIVDYPVSNYQPWQVVTQMHQQLLNCVIDYRPLYLPYKAALTIENFNISSNITSKTPTSIVRFIAEEASFFISSKVASENRDRPEDLSIDLKNDYVCVIDLGLFELSLRLTNNGDKEPLTDLRASNNILHIYTCADSAFATMELLRYTACDGDLRDGNMADNFSMKSHDSNEDILVNFQGEQFEDPDVPCMGTGDEFGSDEGVPHLVEEAMNDTFDVKPKKQRARRDKCERTEVFYFPNENDVSFHFSKTTNISESEASDEEYASEYCIVDQEIGMGYMSQNDDVPIVRLLTDEPIRIVDNHFTVPVEKFDVLKAPKDYPSAVVKYTLREMTLVWHLYGGNDFMKEEIEPEKNEAKKQVTILSDKKSSSESLCSFDNFRPSRNPSIDSINIQFSNRRSPDASSINFTVNPSRSSPRLSYSDQSSDSPSFSYERQKNFGWKIRGGVNRQHDVSMELKLSKLKYQYEVYPKNTKQASRQVFAVQDVEVVDRMASSQINKFLYLYSSSAKPKQSNAHMVVIKSTYIRPELNVSNRLECCLRVSLLPLRLNIDQDSFLFLAKYFNEISGNKSDEVTLKNNSPTKPSSQPVMNIEHMNTSSSSAILNEIEERRSSPSSTALPSNAPVFIRSFIFSPEVPIRLDYEGKRVDMSHGPLAGLIMGLGKLTSSDLKLKRLCNRHGILGFEKLISYVITEWLNDIKKNQLPSLLGGVGPMNSLVQLFQGIRDLFWLPIEQYQKDGRIVRGLQRGANSFTTSTAMAALELTARLVYAIQRIAETAFDLVSPGPSIRHLKYYERTGKNDPRKGRRYHQKHNQPADIREGVASALQLVKEGIEETAHTLIRVAAVENEVKGAVGAVGGIIREMPSAALTPIILATQATSNVLDGVRSHLVPDAKTEAALKWKTSTPNDVLLSITKKLAQLFDTRQSR